MLCYNPAAVTDSAQPPTSPPLSSPAPAFAHAAEAEFARLLDFYGLRWEYEPRTFVLYVEITTIKPRQVRRKNRKIRWLLEHHPDINIKLFKRSDFRQLMAKYGLDDDDRSAWLGLDSQTDSDENDDLSHHRHL